jgi:hypothetical protein
VFFQLLAQRVLVLGQAARRVYPQLSPPQEQWVLRVRFGRLPKGLLRSKKEVCAWQYGVFLLITGTKVGK